MTKTDVLIVAVFVVIIAVAAIGAYTTWSDCSAIGGTTVKGVFGYECIGGKP